MSGYIKHAGLAGAVLLGWMAMVLSAQGASFDCGKAGSKVEKLICGDAELSKLDKELSAAYKTALKDQTQADSIKKEQKLWLKMRNSCAEAACVKGAYETRLQTLALSAPTSISDAVVMNTSSPSQATKGCYKLVVGKRFAMCREFEKNLKRYCDEPPMMCRFKIHPNYGKDFSMPKWEEIDPLQHLDLVADIIRSYFRCDGDERCSEQQWQRKKPGYMEGIRAGRVVLSRARVDLNHDGSLELVYRLSGEVCSPEDLELDLIRRTSVPNFTLMVVNEQTGKADPDYSKWNLGAYDVLLYQGRAHLIRSEVTRGDVEIHDILSSATVRFALPMNTLCGYEYSDKRGQ